MKVNYTQEQTAVDWLVEQIFNDVDLKDSILKLAINQAKEMEKEQKGYSEEDLKEAFKQVRYCIIFEDTQFEDWLQKFKNRIICK